MSTLLLTACLVIGVPDGDTLKVKCPARKSAISVRLAGIDAPEIAHKAFGIREQPWGRESKAALAGICLKQPATVHKVATDRYGRMVANVECGKVSASQYQVQTGNAWAYLYAKRSPLPKLETQAREAHAGLWAEPVPATAPWVWRKKP